MSTSHGFAWKINNFNELEHETAHCMHELLDLCYLSEFVLFLWYMNVPSLLYASARSQYIINWAATQCGILTSVDSDEPVQPPFKLTNSKRCSVSSLTLRIFMRLAKALIRLCICTGWSVALLIVGNLMSRLNYILPRHRTQSRTFANMINSWHPVCPWFDLTRRRRSSGSKLFANFKSRW